MARVQFAQQNTVKTANQNSRINFYFVTSFYSLYDICMADGVRIRSSCLGKRQSRAVNFELFSASPVILNCLVYNYGLQGKLIYYLTSKQDYSPNPFNALSAALLTASLAFLFASFTFSATMVRASWPVRGAHSKAATAPTAPPARKIPSLLLITAS